MNSAELKTNFIAQISKAYPSLSPDKISPHVSDQLLSPYVIDLPASVLPQAQDFVASLFKERQNPKYMAQFSDELNRLNLKTPGNYSILMSYDFHLDQNSQLQLIEINTNASFLALGNFMYKAHGIAQPIGDFTLQEICTDVLKELALNRTSSVQQPHIAIIDDQPETQRLYLEFLVFAELFKSQGWQASICDYRKIPENTDFIYNRYTDFLLADPSSQNIKDLFNQKKVTLSPNPIEYLLLADKKRMIEWGNSGLPDAITRHLPKSQVLTSSNAEEIWNQRKNLFFKPMQSFGSKQTYKGAKISRRLFDEISSQGFLAQDYVPAPEKIFQGTQGPEEFKYDLRFYAYQGRVQSVLARIYQGQVTNLKTLNGGFAPVKFV